MKPTATVKRSLAEWRNTPTETNRNASNVKRGETQTHEVGIMSADIFEAAHAPSSAIHSWDHASAALGPSCFCGLGLHYWALSPRHPLCEFVRRITDWLVVPISRVVPTRVVYIGRRCFPLWPSQLWPSWCIARSGICRRPDWPHHCSLCNDGPLGA